MLSGSFTLALKKFFNFVCQWTEGHNHWHTTTLTEKELTHKDILQFLVAFSRYRPEVDILPGRTWKCSMRSAFYWFAEFCHSQRLSHFAASFIVTWAEGSIAENCKEITNFCNPTEISWRVKKWCLPKAAKRPTPIDTPGYTPGWINITDGSTVNSKVLIWIRVNDPSAGSPTETLLRLLLPLSGKVHRTFPYELRCRRTHRSEQFTGSLNR